MSRGRLRIFLGAAPGVGKTFAMLEEGHRLRAEGRDAVIGFVETHSRAETAALIGDLAVVPRRRLVYRGAVFEEMDLDAVLDRKPEVALVDELAHTNVPGSRHPKRWQDAEELLEAGIDVISTLNIQHLESLNDVICEITGVLQRETIPDDVVRRADELELSDLTHEGIRQRLAQGKIYPAERIDAALANYFRPGNLSALRELALSWTADRVDEVLATYRQAHGIDEPWETKERVVVGVTGAAGGEDVVRRAARMAMRSRAELLGVHVRPTDGLTGYATSSLDEQRELLRQLGGTYHEIVGDDVGEALLAFANAENATQIVLGASRRSRLQELVRGVPILKVIRGSGRIDVHVISHEPAEPPPLWRHSGRSAALSLRRRVGAWVATVVGLPVLTAILTAWRDRLTLESILLTYLLAAVAIGVIGGAWPAVAAAVGGFLLANWYFTPPRGTWTIGSPDDVVALVTFLLVSTAVGFFVGLSTRRSADARRARAQAEALAITASQAGPRSREMAAIVARIRETFGLTSVAVLKRHGEGWEPLATVGIPELHRPEEGGEVIPMSADIVLVLLGGGITGDDRRVLRAFAAQMVQAMELQELEREAGSVGAMVETDRLRSALLSAVSHDLRTPLATIKASVTSLLETGVDWSTEETQAFLDAILDETEKLNRLVGRLLDASRIQVGAVHVLFRLVGLDEVVAAALAGLGSARERVAVDVPESLPDVQTDPALLERVIANLVENAVAWSPPETPVRVTAGMVSERIDLRIIDRGPGIPAAERDTVLQPFQRLGDSSHHGGVGLGLAVARGFLDAMGHELLIEDTPGGGTTMVVGLKVASKVRSDTEARI